MDTYSISLDRAIRKRLHGCFLWLTVYAVRTC